MKKGVKLCRESNCYYSVNMSTIWDTLLRKAAHYTDNYASDLFIDYETVMRYIREYELGSSKQFIFGMRRNGIDHAEFVFNKDSTKEQNRYGKIYQLDIKPDKRFESDNYIMLELWEIEYTYGEKYKGETCTYAPIDDESMEENKCHTD